MPCSTVQELEPFMKYPGRKYRLAKQLRGEVWEPHQHRRLFMLFGGSGSEGFTWNARQAVLNDINPHVVNVHRWVRSGGLNDMQLPMAYDRDLYLQYRSLFNVVIRTEEGARSRLAAELFLYLVQTGFNGLVRFSSRGWSVPFGQFKSVNYKQSYQPWSAAMRYWELQNHSFEEAEFRPADLVVFDPPYDSDKPGDFTQYFGGVFNWDRQVLLAKKMAEHPGPSVGFNRATPRIIGLYESLGFEIRPQTVRRSIAAQTKGRKKTEIVILLKNI